jgi:hypothetical protein
VGAAVPLADLPSALKGLADEKVMRSTFTVAYDSVLPAWQ